MMDTDKRKRLMRQIIKQVHPDLFTDFQMQRAQNSESLKVKGKGVPSGQGCRANRTAAHAVSRAHDTAAPAVRWWLERIPSWPVGGGRSWAWPARRTDGPAPPCGCGRGMA
jgi:hypothetical protein